MALEELCWVSGNNSHHVIRVALSHLKHKSCVANCVISQQCEPKYRHRHEGGDDAVGMFIRIPEMEVERRWRSAAELET